MKAYFQSIFIIVLLCIVSCQKDKYDATMAKVDYSTTINGFEVNFLNQSVRADSYSWDLGDGTKSNETNPVHVYERSDFYSITLTAYKDGKVVATKSSMIIVGVIANFIHQVAGDGLSVSFINRSENVESLQWNFGDGTTSNEESPKHVYSDFGVKTVELTVQGKYGGEASSKMLVLLAPPLHSPLSAWEKVHNSIEREADNTASKMQQLKVAVDDKYVSFYMLFDGLSKEELKYTGAGFFIDTDGNTVTGNQGIYGAGCDLFVDGPIFSGTGSMFDSNTDGAGWDWKNYRPSTDRIFVQNLQTLPNGKVAVVVSILRSEMFPLGDRIGFGLSFVGSSWGFTKPWTNTKAYYYLKEDTLKFERFPN